MGYPAPILAGTYLSDKQLSATSDVDGTFNYVPDMGTILPIGAHELTATFTPKDQVRYAVVTATVHIVVNPSPVRPPNPRPSLKEVEVSTIRGTHLAAQPGEDTTVFVHLTTKALNALTVRMYQASAIQPFFADDGSKQASIEEFLWGELIKGEKNVGLPLQLAAHNEDVGFELAFKSITADQLNTIRTDQGRYYFLANLIDVNGKPVLSVCFSLNKDGTVRYCRNHNS